MVIVNRNQNKVVDLWKLKQPIMATNRLYVVNTETKEYCCIAKCFEYQWKFGNAKIFDELLSDISGLDETTGLIFGTENDDDFYQKWIKEGINKNKDNEWIYY